MKPLPRTAVAGWAHTRRRPGLRTYTLTAVSAAVVTIAWVVWFAGGEPSDARAIYLGVYSGGAEGNYIWSPAFEQLITPVRSLLPFEAWVGFVRALELVALVVMAPLGAWLALFLPPVASEINAGNINLILIACVVASLRWPWAWALPLLTKPSMGVGLVWYAVRREWRPLALAVVPTMLMCAVSFASAPGAWFDWIDAVGNRKIAADWPFPWPIWYRLPIAVVLVVWGARTNRRWTVALAAVLALPRLYFMTPAMLIGLIPLLRIRLPAKQRRPSVLTTLAGLAADRFSGSLPVSGPGRQHSPVRVEAADLDLRMADPGDRRRLPS